MLDRQQLETFATVVQHKNFGFAATVLNVTRGAVSQRIKALEEAVGTVLLIREAPVTPTLAGDAILRHIKALQLLEEDTLERIKPHASGPASIAVAVNADSLGTWFGPIACWLARQRIALELIVDDQDHTLRSLARGEVVGCISTERDAQIGFVAEPVGAMRYQCVATPDFVHQHFQKGLTVQQVLMAPAVLFNRKDALHDSFLESVFGFRIKKYIKHYFPSPPLLLTAICEAVGYGLVPSIQIEPLLQSKKLVDLAPTYQMNVELFWHHWQLEPPPAALISRSVIEQARRALLPPT